MSADGGADEPEDERNGKRRQGADPDGAPIYRPSPDRQAAWSNDHIVLLDIDIRRAARHNSSLLKTFHTRGLQSQDQSKLKRWDRDCGVTSRVYKLVFFPQSFPTAQSRKPCAGGRQLVCNTLLE